MNDRDTSLPDILRATELTDFGDLFGCIRRLRQWGLLTFLALATPVAARLRALTTKAASHMNLDDSVA